MSRKGHLPEVGLALLPEGRNPGFEFMAIRSSQTPKSLQGTFDVFAFSGVDQHLGDRGGKRAADGEFGCHELGRGEAFALGRNGIDNTSRE